MARAICNWLLGALVLVALLTCLAYWRGDQLAMQAIAMGAGVSLVALLASNATVAASGWGDKPLHRLLIETNVRVALPLAFLLAVVVARRDLLSESFLLYFLPFQLLTIAVSAAASIHHIQQRS